MLIEKVIHSKGFSLNNWCYFWPSLVPLFLPFVDGEEVRRRSTSWLLFTFLLNAIIYLFNHCHFRSSQWSIIKQNWRVEESLWKKPKVRDNLTERSLPKHSNQDHLSYRSEDIPSSINDIMATFKPSIKKWTQDNCHRNGRQNTYIKIEKRKP